MPIASSRNLNRSGDCPPGITNRRYSAGSTAAIGISASDREAAQTNSLFSSRRRDYDIHSFLQKAIVGAEKMQVIEAICDQDYHLHKDHFRVMPGRYLTGVLFLCVF